MTTNNEAFDVWFESRLAHCEYDKDYVKVMIEKKPWLLIGFEAATNEANKRIAELESEIAELKAVIEVNHALMQADDKEIEALQSYINVLRKALQFYADGRHYDYCDKQSSERFGLDWIVEYGDIASEALTKTPAQSLQAHDNEVLERAAKEFDNHEDEAWITRKIRALKG